MMTLLWFLLGTLVCIGVSRYNESDDLFWKLFISFTGAFIAASIVKTVIEDEKQDKVVMVEKAPTQELTGVLYNFCTVTNTPTTAPEREKSPKPVSKGSNFQLYNNILSKALVLARGQPNSSMYFDDS